MADTLRAQVRRVPLDDVRSSPGNVKAHDVDLVADSIRRFGFADPLVVDQRTGELLAGHGRLEALRRLRALVESDARDDGGRPYTVPAGITDDWRVPVYVGWASANDDEADAARVALNRTTEAGGWDERALVDLLDRLSTLDDGLVGVGYGSDEIDALRSRLDALDAEPEPPPAKPWPHRAADDATCDVIVGDCREVMAEMDADSVDAVVCDPPYGLEFMGKGWDKFRADAGVDRAGRWAGERSGDGGGQIADGAGDGYGRVTHGMGRPVTSRCEACGKRDAWRKPHGDCPDDAWVAEPVEPNAAPPGSLAFGEWVRQWAVEALRVAKPGGHLIAFGGTRTHHRLMVGLEDAGWEIRDCGVWLYRSGFPKSLDVGKAIEGRDGDPRDAATWEGWGTSLKPAIEPWVLARRPLGESSVAANVLRWGTGALNIDACRAAMTDEDRERFARGSQAWHEMALRRGEGRKPADVYGEYGIMDPSEADDAGRWPANVVTLEDDEDLRFFHAAIGAVVDEPKASADEKPWHAASHGLRYVCEGCGHGQYHANGDGCPKCGSRLVDRRGGSTYTKVCETCGGQNLGPPKQRCGCDDPAWVDRDDDDLHPTVKPLDVMRHLVRLVTPPGGKVLDPFAGTGTTGEAALIEGFDAVLVEAHEPYRPLIEERLTRTGGEGKGSA